MAQVVVQVNDRPYTMQCSDGEERHLQELARLLDGEVTRIKESVGPVGDIRVLLMAGLMVADQLAEARRRIEELEDQVNGLRESRMSAVNQGRSIEDQMAERLNSAAKRLEALSVGLDGQ
ncbi:MAG TPA: cell division protein ZapA [Aestuariivirgaceae bacterium]|jgi:cell division protein ZapA|nr:cell division protein ZapA [Aestuariivirgaceae bacterium]